MKRYIRSAEGLTVEEIQKLAKTSTDPQELARLANNEDEWVRAYVAKNSSTPIAVLEQLATDDDYYVRGYVAQNPNTPAKVLASLANDDNSYPRYWVAQNPNTPAEILAQLVNDEDHNVRFSLTMNPSIPPDILAQLGNDKSAYVRQGVAENLNTPPDILAQLANDKDKYGAYVRQLAAENPNTPADAIPDPSKSNPLKSGNWRALISELKKECEEYDDPLYELSPAGEKLLDLCYEVEDAMHFYLEPSVQAGQGDISIYDNDADESLVGSVDYAEFNADVIDMALESSSANKFKRAYKTYLLNVVE